MGIKSEDRSLLLALLSIFLSPWLTDRSLFAIHSSDLSSNIREKIHSTNGYKLPMRSA